MTPLLITVLCFLVLSFEEQIKIDLSTDIMVGPHGAGLMHNIFMRDRAALVEVQYVCVCVYGINN